MIFMMGSMIVLSRHGAGKGAESATSVSAGSRKREKRLGLA